LIENNLTQTVYDADMARAMSARSAGSKRPLNVHIKVDTGMSRLGFVWRGEETLRQLVSLCKLPNLHFEGLFTHLASSEDASDPDNEKQIAAFMMVRDFLRSEGHHFDICHCANSGAVIQYPQAQFDMVRTGLLLYGIAPSKNLKSQMDLIPAMRLCSVVSQVKTIEKGDAISYGRTFRAPSPMHIAVVAAGYADGYPRALSGRADVLVNGCRVPIVGTVCMDMLMVDVTNVPRVRDGATVTLFGSDGSCILPVDELADTIGSISYELICSVGKRVLRVYLQNGMEVGCTNYLLGDEEYVSHWPPKPHQI
jgi:alanine racemase